MLDRRAVTAARAPLPVGTVTFLRTDVEGSMRHAAAMGSRWDALNDRQARLVRDAVAENGGQTVRTEGDACFAVFPDAVAAVRAAIAVQRAITGHAWPDDATVRVRIGLHSGEAHLAGDDYGGFDVNRAARVAAVGHGGQIVLSDPTRALVVTDLPAGVTVRDLGRHVLKDVPHPEHLFQLDVPGLPLDFPPLRTRIATPGNLPPRLTSFIGREGDLGAARRLLDAGRLLTITGPGGMGKTSLAIELARDAAGEFTDGAWLVELAEVTRAADVPLAIARAFEVYEGPERPVAEGIIRHLAEREALVVLDNFEHVLDAASFVRELLMRAEALRLIVTSRAPLRITGEQEYPLGPLGATGGPSTDAAVRLFVERAQAARPDWQPGADLAVVEDICARLDGLPLGIELAAARVPLLSPQMLRDRLVARLPLPSAGLRNLPDRQRTLEAAIGWSADMLDEAQRGLLRRLAVFEGGFDLDQAHAVMGGGDVLDDILQLADHSLIVRDVVAEATPVGSNLRFRMLETIRSFGLRELSDAGEEAEIRDRHADAFLVLAEEAARHWLTTEQAVWLDRLTADHANLRAAVEASIEHGRIERAQRLAAALWRYWQFGGHLREGRELADRVAALAPDEPTPARLWALGAAGGLAYWQGESAVANDHYREQLVVAEQVGDEVGEADALFNLSATDFILGGRGSSMEYLNRAQALYDRLGDSRGAARARWALHNVLVYEGRPEEALPILAELETTFDANGDLMYQGLTAGSHAFIGVMTGDVRAAMHWGARALATHHTLRDTATATIMLGAGAIVLAAAEHPREAAVALGAFEDLSEQYGVRPPAGLGYLFETFRPVERTFEVLKAEEYAELMASGRRMSLDEAVAWCLEVFEQVASGVSPPATE